MIYGQKGAIVFDGTIETVSTGVPTKVVGMTGAGDIFAGSILYGMTDVMSLPERADVACKTAVLAGCKIWRQSRWDVLCDLLQNLHLKRYKLQ
jgi:sugar/nucleoside kinase (ribokinase family)